MRSPASRACAAAQAGFLQRVLAEAEADASQRQQTHQDRQDGKAHGARAGAGSAAGGPAAGQRGVRPAPPRTPRSGPAALACGSQGQGQGHTPASAAGASAGRQLKRPSLPGASGAKPGAGGARSGSAKRPPPTAAGAAAAGSSAASDAGAPASAVQEKLAKLLQVRSRPRAPRRACLPCSSAEGVASVPTKPMTCHPPKPGFLASLYADACWWHC